MTNVTKQNTSSRWLQRSRVFGAAVLITTSLATFAFAALAPISGALVLRGTFVVQGERLKVQHRDGGRIEKIHVALGDQVNAGDVLVTFDLSEQKIRQQQLIDAGAFMTKKLALVADELKSVKALYSKELVTKQRYLVLEKERVQLEADAQDARLKLKEIEGLLAHSTVRAPCAGRIVDLPYNAAGGVVRGGEKIMEIVPVGAKLLIDARLEAQQIDDINASSEAEVRLSGLNQKTTPTVRGRVTYVSADTLTDERNGARYYQVRATISDEDAARFRIVAGMPVELMVETGRRSVIEYALRPLGDALSRSMREPLKP